MCVPAVWPSSLSLLAFCLISLGGLRPAPLMVCFMNIFTSYFSKASKLDSSRFLVVSISRYNPKGFSGFSFNEFAPSSSLLHDYKQGLCQREYIRRYRRELSHLGELRDSFLKLSRVAHGRDIVLCCYEREESFCHRHVLSDIVFEKYNYRIVEL